MKKENRRNNFISTLNCATFYLQFHYFRQSPLPKYFNWKHYIPTVLFSPLMSIDYTYITIYKDRRRCVK